MNLNLNFLFKRRRATTAERLYRRRVFALIFARYQARNPEFKELWRNKLAELRAQKEGSSKGSFGDPPAAGSNKRTELRAQKEGSPG